MRPFRIGLSFPVESDCPVSLRQRLELGECVGAEDALTRSEDLSDCCKSGRLCLGMDIELEPPVAGVIASVLETNVFADVALGEDEGEVDDDETSSGNDSSTKSEGSESGTSISLTA